MYVRKVQDAENDEVINVYVPNRLRARKGVSSDQQESFIQCARSEQLPAMSTFERVYCVDIYHDNCGHAKLTRVQIRDGFDGRGAFEEILRNPILYLGSVNNILAFVVKMFEPTSGDARTDHLSRHT